MMIDKNIEQTLSYEEIKFRYSRIQKRFQLKPLWIKTKGIFAIITVPKLLGVYCNMKDCNYIYSIEVEAEPETKLTIKITKKRGPKLNNVKILSKHLFLLEKSFINYLIDNLLKERGIESSSYSVLFKNRQIFVGSPNNNYEIQLTENSKFCEILMQKRVVTGFLFTFWLSKGVAAHELHAVGYKKRLSLLMGLFDEEDDEDSTVNIGFLSRPISMSTLFNGLP